MTLQEVLEDKQGPAALIAFCFFGHGGGGGGNKERQTKTVHWTVIAGRTRCRDDDDQQQTIS